MTQDPFTQLLQERIDEVKRLLFQGIRHEQYSLAGEHLAEVILGHLVRDGSISFSFFSSLAERMLKEKDDIINDLYFARASHYFAVHKDRKCRYTILDRDMRLRIMYGDDPALEETALFVLPYVTFGSEIANVLDGSIDITNLK